MSRTHLVDHATITGLAVPLANAPDLNADVAANTAARHAAITLGGTNSAALTLTGAQELTLDDTALPNQHAAVTLGTGNSAALALTGQELILSGVTLLADIPSVTQAQAGAAGNAINTTDKTVSRKIFITDLNGGTTLFAGGTAATDPWRQGGVDVITPV